ncbi:uncharacterized protein LOC110224370 [Arabidopsis lyrata subsp. lyrata]|uniref:uncharacterized protein LOC110224370 n=1 Tax=Arabidopsis lyrata subsp. lyrata TaxID=81972 RepID=UPI000A29AD5C|nr:uncharacterized protein LOC110224370 [Arabidopsis lyrata subsp. lyrata]|eukprot:XP_020866014.1 uncharacterized protein LOC110224370 [Arabidopsis lyrata subsp. lyrata]
MANKLLYCVIFSMFLLLTMLRVWRTTAIGPHVYNRKELIERLFESGFACLRVGFHEDQKYFRSYFLQ